MKRNGCAEAEMAAARIIAEATFRNGCLPTGLHINETHTQAPACCFENPYRLLAETWLFGGGSARQLRLASAAGGSHVALASCRYRRAVPCGIGNLHHVSIETWAASSIFRCLPAGGGWPGGLASGYQNYSGFSRRRRDVARRLITICQAYRERRALR